MGIKYVLANSLIASLVDMVVLQEVSGDIDGRVEQCGNAPHFDFFWSGQDENDPACGRGWAVIENGELNGRIYLHLADDSAFRAIKIK